MVEICDHFHVFKMAIDDNLEFPTCEEFRRYSPSIFGFYTSFWTILTCTWHCNTFPTNSFFEHNATTYDKYANSRWRLAVIFNFSDCIIYLQLLAIVHWANQNKNVVWYIKLLKSCSNLHEFKIMTDSRREFHTYEEFYRIMSPMDIRILHILVENADMLKGVVR